MAQEAEFCKTSSRHCNLKSELDLASLVGKLGLGFRQNFQHFPLYLILVYITESLYFFYTWTRYKFSYHLLITILTSTTEGCNGGADV